jgi:hypothetical protein
LLIAALVIFFSAFNILEATLPSLVSKTAPAEAKGTALGGWINQHAGTGGVFVFTIVLALLWLVAAVTLRPRA